MLEIKNLSKSFHENKVLDHINLKIEKGDVVGIISPSGTGKSTLLRCINQLEILPLSYIDSHPAGDIISRIIADRKSVV